MLVIFLSLSSPVPEEQLLVHALALGSSVHIQLYFHIDCSLSYLDSPPLRLSVVQYLVLLPLPKERGLRLGTFVCLCVCPHRTFVFSLQPLLGLRRNFHDRCAFSCGMF